MDKSEMLTLRAKAADDDAASVELCHELHINKYLRGAGIPLAVHWPGGLRDPIVATPVTKSKASWRAAVCAVADKVIEGMPS